MARIPFQKPKTIEWQILSDRYGRLVAEPFEKGYALTVGNSLRRTLLSIIPGAAVTWARVTGVKDVETPLPGVAESTQDVLLNLKKLAVNGVSAKQTTRLASVSATSRPISPASAGDDVSPGDSIPNRLTSPLTPWSRGPWIRKSCTATAGGTIFGRIPE